MTRRAAHIPVSVTKETLPGDEEVWRTAQGEVRARVPAPGVVIVAVIGQPETATYPLMVSKVEREIALGRRVSWFGDYEKMTSYDPDVRTLLVDFTRTNLVHFAVIGLFVNSKLVTLAANVANVMLGGSIKIYTARDELELAVQRRLTSRTTRAKKIELYRR